MHVTEIQAEGLKREYKIVIPASHLETKIQERLGELANTVKMPGFRPGKVPHKLLRQRYGAAVWGEVMEKSVDEATRKVMEEKGVRPAGDPKFDLLKGEEGSDLEFTLALEVMPEIKPMDFATIKLEREKATVGDDEINDALKHIAERDDNSEAVDRAAADGDVVVIDFVGKQDGIAFPGGAADDYRLKLGSGSFIPGFEEELIGKKAGDEVLVSLSFPEAYGNGDLAGKPAQFEVKVKEVHAVTPPVLDDAFAQKLGLDTLDALKAAIAERLGQDLDQLSRGRLKRALLDVLADNHDFPVPAALADHEFDAIWKQVEDDRAAGRSDPEDADKSDEQLRTEYRALAERRVRLGLLLAEVAHGNNLTVNPEDLNRAMMEEARRYPGQEHMVFQYYRTNPQALDQLRAPIFEEKVVDFILELAQVTDKPVTAADLRAEPGAPAQAADAEEPAAEAKPKKKTTKKKTAE